MIDIDLIKKYLPEDLWEFASKFDIPEDFLLEMNDLIEMVLRSKSIDTDDEKQNWFNLLPLMNNEQTDKLRDILVRERKKLEEIEKKYDHKKMEIKKKYLLKWQKMWYIKKVSEIQKTEQATKTKEDEEAEQLLDMI